MNALKTQHLGMRGEVSTALNRPIAHMYDSEIVFSIAS
jgi:hypothetical protein